MSAAIQFLGVHCQRIARGDDKVAFGMIRPGFIFEGRGIGLEWVEETFAARSMRLCV